MLVESGAQRLVRPKHAGYSAGLDLPDLCVHLKGCAYDGRASKRLHCLNPSKLFYLEEPTPRTAHTSATTFAQATSPLRKDISPKTAEV